jgi:anti-sigma factor RsiW
VRRCAQHRQRISQQVDGELGPRGRLLALVHLARCEDCREFRAELEEMTAALRSTALVPAAAAAAPSVALRRYLLPQRLALVGGIAVLGLALTTSGVLDGGSGRVRALSPVQGLPVYSIGQEGMPVYNQPSSALLPIFFG